MNDQNVLAAETRKPGRCCGPSINQKQTSASSMLFCCVTFCPLHDS